ncbi:MAG: glycosyltransferase family A protein [Candidatus Omnitrophota bacterium]|jgi:glycosyltransferase involved in cell wall biosynthesis
MFPSIIIPTYNRLDLLKRVLFSIENQTLAHDSYEVIIVDDGSKDKTSEFVKKYIENKSWVKYIEQRHLGPAKARNTGIKKALGDILVFTDSDCVCDREWLRQITAPYSENDIIGVVGHTICPGNNLNPFEHQLPDLDLHRMYPTCNISYKKEIILKLGGFDESFKYPHNEDVDLAWRALRCGNIIYNKEAIVLHTPTEESIKNQVLKIRYLVSEFRLKNKHPDMYKKERPASDNLWRFIYIDCLIKNKVKTASGPGFLDRYKSPELFFRSFVLHVLRNLYFLLLFPVFYLNRNKK